MHGSAHGIVSGTISSDSQYDFPLLREEKLMRPVFFLVQPTPPSMLLHVCFPGVFGGGKKTQASLTLLLTICPPHSLSSGWKTRICLPRAWVIIQFSLVDGKSCSLTLFMPFSSHCGANNLHACPLACLSGKASTDLNQTRSNSRLL